MNMPKRPYHIPWRDLAERMWWFAVAVFLGALVSAVPAIILLDLSAIRSAVLLGLGAVLSSIINGLITIARYRVGLLPDPEHPPEPPP